MGYREEFEDLRQEYRQIEHEQKMEQVRIDAGCTEDCPHDCDCVQNYLDDIAERKAMNTDFYASRGI